MPFLIDGHNLISQLDDLELSDPDDEAKLVLKLRGFAARTRKKCTVIFDQGLPGGSSALTTYSVAVIFASANQTNADRIIRERISTIPDAPNWTVVSSDNEVLDNARIAGMRPMRCNVFAQLLNRPTQPDVHKGLQANVMVSEQEIQEWMDLFGIDDTDELTETPPRRTQRPQKKTPKRPTPTRKSIKSAQKRSEVDEWLAAFGAEDEIGQLNGAPDAPDPRRRPPTRKRRRDDAQKDTTPAKPRAEDAPTTPQKPTGAGDVDGWLAVFGSEDDTTERQPTDKAERIQPRHPRKRQSASPQAADENTKDRDDLKLSANTVDEWLEVFGGEPDPDREPTDPADFRTDPKKQGRFKTAQGKREPNVHKRMATSDDLWLSDGEVDAWLDVFGADDEDDDGQD